VDFVPPPASHALGASPADILDYVLKGVVAQSALGVYWSVSRWLAGRLFGLSALDPLTLVAAVGASLAVAVAAAVVPVLHATRIDPSEALRAD
jgi:putative ABC transport system permease protein